MFADRCLQALVRVGDHEPHTAEAEDLTVTPAVIPVATTIAFDTTWPRPAS